MGEDRKFRLVTRSDFDGLVCAVLLKELDLIDEITFVHPKDMQDGRVPVDERVITTNLPYVEGCHLAFDHHVSEIHRLGPARPENHIIDPDAPSAARVLWDHYGAEKTFPAISEEMMWAVDRGDAAIFTEDEIRDPQGWVLLNFMMDARTGLGRFQQFREFADSDAVFLGLISPQFDPDLRNQHLFLDLEIDDPLHRSHDLLDRLG